jgi:predicted enzyme related to lactoylglutathione lyase
VRAHGDSPQASSPSSPSLIFTLVAHKFYSTVFSWYFKPPREDVPDYEVRSFDFSPDINLGGGIVLVPDDAGVLKTGHGGTCMHWFVEDIEKTSQTITSAGGKMLSDAQPEGKFGLYRYFEDSEGNVGSIYQIAPSQD